MTVNTWLVRSSLLALSLSAAVSAVTLFGCGGSGGAETATTGETQQAHHHPQRPPGVKVCDAGGQAHTIPAQIEGRRDASDITTAVIFTVNGWIAGDCRGRTIVYAGSAGWKGSMGLAIISRFGHGSKQLGGGFIPVSDSGPLKITRAPEGPGVVTSAQRSGDIQFTSDRGITGTIHLGDDTATLSTGEVIRAVPDVRSIESG
jgi:hypothetical protein